MAQWVNRLWNKIFVNAPPLPLLCEISGAQPGLTAGWRNPVLRQAGRLAGRQAGRLAVRRNTGEFRNFQSWL